MKTRYSSRCSKTFFMPVMTPAIDTQMKLRSTTINIVFNRAVLPRPFIIPPCLIHPVRFPCFYNLIFLPKSLFYARGNCRFIPICLIPLCTGCLIIKILPFGRIEFLIKCLNRIKFIFPHNITYLNL